MVALKPPLNRIRRPIPLRHDVSQCTSSFPSQSYTLTVLQFPFAFHLKLDVPELLVVRALRTPSPDLAFLLSFLIFNSSVLVHHSQLSSTDLEKNPVFILPLRILRLPSLQMRLASCFDSPLVFNGSSNPSTARVNQSIRRRSRQILVSVFISIPYIVAHAVSPAIDRQVLFALAAES